MMEWRRDLTIGLFSLVPALVITFVSDHSFTTGLAAFSAWAVLSGAVVSLGFDRSRADILWRSAWILTLIAGCTSAALLFVTQSQFFPILIGVWATAFGLLATWRRVGAFRFVGIVSVALGLAELLMPANAVVNVGLLGAYWVVIAVWLVIGALSPSTTVEGEGEVSSNA